MTALDLLPPNAKPFERALSAGVDLMPRVSAGIAAIRNFKARRPLPSDAVPWLFGEWGFDLLYPFVDDETVLLEDAREFYRLRGTPAAQNRGLAFVGYSGSLEEHPVRRRRWNLFQQALARFRDAEEPDLNNIEGICGLAAPARSKFWRGFHGYDVRAVELGWTRWGQNIWGDCSGVRIREGGAKWSFGRAYNHDVTLSQLFLEQTGTWIAPIPGNFEGHWDHLEWPHVQWSDNVVLERRDNIARGVAALPCWFRFKDSNNSVIGYRRARICRPISLSMTPAEYVVGSQNIKPAVGRAAGVYAEALTAFGDGYGETAASFDVVFGAEVVDQDKPGIQWAEPDEVSGGYVATTKTVEIEFGRTVRERCKALLRVA